MGTTIDFYSSTAEALVGILQTEDFEEQFAALDALPKADLGIHLIVPDDLDLLCRALRSQGIEVPETFLELIDDEPWNDGEDGSAWLYVLTERLLAFGAASDAVVDGVWMAWVETDAAREALRELRVVCRHAQEHHQSVLVYLCY